MHKQWHKVCTALLLESGGHAMSEMRPQQNQTNWHANSTCYFLSARPCWSSAPNTTLGISTFVGAVYKDILHHRNLWSVSSIPHAVLCSLPVLHKTQHNIPFLVVCHVFLYLLHISLQTRCTNLAELWADCVAMELHVDCMCNALRRLTSLLLAEPEACFGLSPSPPCIPFIVKCCNCN